MIEIKDINGVTRYSTEINEGSKRVCKLNLEADSITLEFSTVAPIAFALGDYCDVENEGRFEIIELQKPEISSESGACSYSLRLDAPYLKWRNKIFKYSPSTGGYEAEWNLTATLDIHANILLDCLSFHGFAHHYSGAAYEIDIDSTIADAAKLITYSNVDLISALQLMAETYECDVWITDNIIHFGRCEASGTPTSFIEGANVTAMTASKSSSTYATRLYAFGSTRNLPPSYRPIEGVVANGVLQKRLMLPEGTPYIDAYDNMTAEQIVEAVVVLDDIYPRTNGTVDEVTTYTDTTQDSQGNDITEIFYRFTEADKAFKFSSEYLLADTDTNLSVTFQSGRLNGMTFEVNFNPKGASEKNGEEWNPEAQLFEIIANENYGRKLPDTTLYPERGDKYVLFGWDSTKIAELGLVAKAEQELLTEAKKVAEKYKKDPNTYDCTLFSDYAFGIDPNGNLNDSYAKTFGLGDVVALYCDALLGSGSYTSRIIGFEYPLDKPFDSPKYTVGESAAYSKRAEMQQQIDTLTMQGKTYTSTGGGRSVYIISSKDATTATDRNVYSALRTKQDFLTKKGSDRTPFDLAVGGNLKAEQGAHFGDYVKSLYAGIGAGIDADGTAEFESVRVRSYFECLELIINRLSAIEGDQLLTEGDTVERVDDLGDNCYGLHLKSKWDGYFTAQYPNNVLKGIVNTLSAGSGVYYTSWMRVNSVNTANNYIEVTLYPDKETPAGQNYPPCEMMKIARWGNQTDKTRQSCIYLSSTEGRIVRLTGVTKPIIDKSNYGATFGALPDFLYSMDLPLIKGQDYVYARGLVVQDIIRIDYQGKLIATIVDRGLWSASADYYCEAQNQTTGVYEISDVWYMGCKWRCAKTGTTTAPAWNNTDWAMVEGNPDFTVVFADTDYIFDPDRFNLTLSVIAKLYNMDVTADILDADVQWTRYSEDAQGVERVVSDQAWALKRANSGKNLTLTTSDCDFNGYIPKTLKFIATVTLRDGMGNEAGTDTAIFQY